MKTSRISKSFANLRRVTGFNERVLTAASTIPSGRVATYQHIARIIGHPRAYRAVGNALHRNPHPIVVPCHRVVASDGSLGGYGDGLKKKIVLLTREGVVIRRGKIDLDVFGVKE